MPGAFGLLMTLVSALGTSWAYATIAIILAFGARLRPALALTLALVTTGVAVDACKRGLAMPRPEHVDVRVSPEAFVDRGGAPDAWSLPARPVIEAVRAAGPRDYGMPSGHVASATVFVLVVRRRFWFRGIAWIAPTWVATMALSRVALGKHFIADLFGGLAIAVVIVGALAWFERRVRPEHHRALAIAGIAVAALAVAIAPLELVAARQLGNLAGTTLACAWALRNDPPRGDLRVRIVRIAVAAAVFASGTVLLSTAGPLPALATAVVSAAIVAATLLVPFVAIVPKRPLGTVPHA